MTIDLSHPSGSALRKRMIEDMSVRGFTEDTRRYYDAIFAVAGLCQLTEIKAPTYR